VNVPRDKLLSRAVLAVNEYASIGGRRHRDLLAKLHHRVALPDHRVLRFDARAERLVLGLEMPLAQRVADDQHRLFQRQRLLDNRTRPS
jgi:hypothetical protein